MKEKTNHQMASWKPGDPVSLAYGGVTVRSLTSDDVTDKMVAQLHDRNTMRFVNLPRRFSKAQFITHIEQHDNKTRYFLGIFPEGHEDCVGYRSISIDKSGTAITSTVIFDRAFHRRGILKILAYMVGKFLYETVQVKKLEARAYSDNQPMLDFFRNSPYKLENTVVEPPLKKGTKAKTYYVFAQSKEDWNATPPPPMKQTSPQVRLTLATMSEDYRSQLTTPVDDRLRALTDAHVSDHIEAITKDLYALRAITDEHFLDLRARAKQGKAKISTEERRRLSQYPVKCCLEITRHMLMLISRDRDPEHKGVQALQNFSRNGGPVKRIWGALREQYFQNAMQVGSFYMDAANDTVDVRKDKIEILPLAEAGFKNIESYAHFAKIAEIYWECKILPNRYFPNLAPYFPIIFFMKNGEISLGSANSFLFPMNLEGKFKPARDYLLGNENRKEEDRHLVETLKRVMHLQRRSLGNQKLWLYTARPRRPQLLKAFDENEALGASALELKCNEVLKQKLLLGRIPKT